MGLKWDLNIFLAGDFNRDTTIPKVLHAKSVQETKTLLYCYWIFFVVSLFLCTWEKSWVDYFEGQEGDEQQQPEATVRQLSPRELMHSECRTSHPMQMFICHASFSLGVCLCARVFVHVCQCAVSWSSRLTCEIMRGHLSQMLCSKARDLPQQIAGSRRIKD